MLFERDELELNQSDFENWTALMFAAQHGNAEIVNVLLKHPRTDVNAQNKKGFTALMLASQNGHRDVITYLITKKTYKDKITK